MSLLPQTGSYIPDSDNGAMMWLLNFSQRLAQSPEALGITPLESFLMSSWAAKYAEAYRTATEVKTRTASTVKAKDNARRQAEEYGRMLAMRIKALPEVDDNVKLSMGIHLDDRGKTPIGPPTTMPVLSIVSAGPGTHTLRFADSASPSSRRKPPGSTHMLLFAEVAPPTVWPTGHDDNLRFIAAVTRNPYLVQWKDNRHLGGTALYKARWLSAKGLLGLWSMPVTMTIAAGGGLGEAGSTGGKAGDEHAGPPLARAA